MDVDKWQKRLESNFSNNGIIGTELFGVLESEKAYGNYFNETFHGQAVLLHAFQEFFIET